MCFNTVYPRKNTARADGPATWGKENGTASVWRQGYVLIFVCVRRVLPQHSELFGGACALWSSAWGAGGLRTPGLADLKSLTRLLFLSLQYPFRSPLAFYCPY